MLVLLFENCDLKYNTDWIAMLLTLSRISDVVDLTSLCYTKFHFLVKNLSSFPLWTFFGFFCGGAAASAGIAVLAVAGEALSSSCSFMAKCQS